MSLDKQDLERHRQDWNLFMGIVIWSSVVTAIILVGLGLYLSP
ncbi:MAG: aa3-type cytochrome c oxidase subunit IV [Alphaproteobacteria bacterium GM7ARS4]|nr:aa3-type cytochrome c oxidase subunit IV [Alphaproteobacteria bacterium GM7ARS4]